MQTTTRRHFLKTSLAAGSTLLIAGYPMPSARAAGANDPRRLCGGSAQGKKQTCSSLQRSRASRAMMRWPICTGLKLPPSNPTRRN